MIESIKSSEKYLYHYTSCNLAINFILKNKNLLLNKYSETNDPKEAREWQFDIGSNENIDFNKYNHDKLSSWLSKELKEKTKLLCFSTESGDLTGDHTRDIFNRGFCKPRMWAQYGDRHKGVCLVFDREIIEKEVQKQFGTDSLVLSGPVTYRNRNVIPKPFHAEDQQYLINIDHLEKLGADKYVSAHLSTHFKRLFFEKMDDWRGESERRYIVFSNSEELLHLDYNDALAGIIFGDKIDEENIITIMNMTNEKHVRHMGLKWKNCSPWYDYENPRYTQGIRNSPWGKGLRWNSKEHGESK